MFAKKNIVTNLELDYFYNALETSHHDAWDFNQDLVM